MAVVDSIVSFAVEKIGDLIIQEAVFLSQVGDQVKELQTELKRMRNFLRCADEGDRRVSEIRDIAYDSEDALETYVLRTASRDETSPSSSSSAPPPRYKVFTRIINCFICNVDRYNPVFLHKIGSDIESLKGRLNSLTQSIPTYMLEEPRRTDQTQEMRRVERRRTYAHQIEQDVGLEDDTNLLLTKLMNPNIGVVWICGMGGLGKTTLAKKIYHLCQDNSKKIDHRCKDNSSFTFSYFFWFYVSQQCQERSIWEKVLYELLCPKGETSYATKEEFRQRWKDIQTMSDDGAVAALLHEQLWESRCLVILDDVWDDAWDVLKAGFPTQGTANKYVVTTRKRNLAFGEHQNGYIHEPRCLNDEQSWTLFISSAIPKQYAGFGFRLDDRMERLGREMVRHCRGLPLAIVVLGGLLSRKRTSDEWDTVHQSIKSYIRKESKVMQLFALSYDDLRYEIKPCFLYLGLLPEDAELARDRLINLWVAEGIVYHAQPRIGTEGEEELEDIAYRYLTELAERYMIQVEKFDSSGRIKKIRMHDLMREFCVSKASKECFFKVVSLQGDTRSSLYISSSSEEMIGRVRRISLHLNNFSSGDFPLNCSEEYPPFRSVVGFSLNRQSEIKQPLMDSLVGSFKLLRVLDLENIKGFAVPKTIGNLVHLRLLNVRSCDIGDLSPSVGNLTFLLTLRLDSSDLEIILPNVFWKLTRLRHLYLPCYPKDVADPLQFANLSQLRTLVNFSTSTADVNDLKRLTNLRKLKIIISDKNSLLTFKKIFASSNNTFSFLRHYSINVRGSAKMLGIDNEDINNIISRCPRLQRLKLDGDVAYQSPTDVFRHDED